MTASADELLTCAEEGLAAAARAGAAKAEVYVWSARSWEARAGAALRAVSESDESGVHVRLEIDGRIAGVKIAGASRAGGAWAAERAAALARLLPRKDSPWVLAQPAACGPVTPRDPALVDAAPDRLMGLAQAVTDRLETVRLLDYRSTTVMTHEARFAVANTEGVRAWDQTAHEGLISEVRAEGAAEASTMRFTVLEPRALVADEAFLARAEAAGRLACGEDRTARLLAPTREVVLDSASAAQVLLSVLPSLAGGAANERRSRFATALGQSVASELVNVVDDPRDGVSVRNYRVDDEGTPTTGRLEVVRDGVLLHHAHSFASARRAGVAPTGHGLRGSTGRYTGAPKSRFGNAAIRAGRETVEELVAGCEDGVALFGGLLGAFTVNPLTGDLSCSATLARRIENGRITGRLDPVTVTGNVFDVWREVRALGRDVTRTMRGSCPAARVGGLTVSE